MIDRDTVTFIVGVYAGLATIAGLGAGFWAAHEQRENNKLEKRTGELQEQLLALETARDAEARLEASRARVDVTHRKEPGQSGKSPRHLMVLTNRGQATATDIAVVIDGVPMEQSKSTPTARNPIRVLGPGAEQPYMLYIQFTGPRSPFDIQVRWRDESGLEGSYHTQIAV